MSDMWSVKKGDKHIHTAPYLALAMNLIGRDMVAEHPNSGAFQVANQNIEIAQQGLMEEAERQQREEASNKAKKKSSGESIGAMVGLAVAVGAAPFTGGTSLLAAPALAGGGAKLGGGIASGDLSSSIQGLGSMAGGGAQLGGMDFSMPGGKSTAPVSDVDLDKYADYDWRRKHTGTGD